MKDEHQRGLAGESALPSEDFNGRRSFIAGLGGAALVAGGMLATAPANAAPRAALPGAIDKAMPGNLAFPALPVHRGEKTALDNLHCEAFSRHLSSHFRAQSENETVDSPNVAVDLELVEAKQGRQHDPDHGLEQFTLTFRGPESTSLGQNTYQFGHNQLGNFALFIVPIGGDDQGWYYEATFNRLRRA